MATAPSAIYSLWNKIDAEVSSAVLSGIVGDVNHSFGYHLSRNELPYNDYSVTLYKDKLGSSYTASALDVSLSPTMMKTVTARLLAAAKARDPRLGALREFCGTTNGTTTHNYDLSNHTEGYGQWDNSHLWHVHLSFYREYANNATVLAGIADVMAGIPLHKSIEEEIMSYYADKAHFEAAMAKIAHDQVAKFFLAASGEPKVAGQVHGIQAFFEHYLNGTDFYNDPNANKRRPGMDLRPVAKGWAAVASAVTAIKTKLGA